MKNLGLYIIPLLVLAAVAVCLDQNHPSVIPFWQAGKGAEASQEAAAPDTLKPESATKPVQSVVDLIDDDYRDTTPDFEEEEQAEVSLADYEEPASTAAAQWRIVVASVKSESQARRLLSQGQFQGMTMIYAPAVDSYRIVGSSHHNLGQAQQSLQDLQERFPAAWISHF